MFQGSRAKRQASSAKLGKFQAASIKPQAPRFKLQAASDKLTDLFPLIKFQAPRTKGLNADKRIVGMTHMPRYLMWTEPNFVTLRDFKFNSEEMIIFSVCQRIWHTNKA